MRSVRHIPGVGSPKTARRRLTALLLALAALGVPPEARAGGDADPTGGGRSSGGRSGGGGSGREWSTWGDVATPAGLSLTLEPGAAGPVGTASPGVRAVLHNDGAESVTVAVDQRLADLELRAGHTRVRCASPDSIEPPDLAGAESATIAAGGGTAAVDIDLLYLCWDRLSRVRRAAGEGPASVRARYRVVLIDPELDQAVGRAGILEAAAELPLGEGGGDGASSGTEPTEGEEEATFRVEARQADVEDGSEVWLHLTVRNAGDAAVKLVDHPTQFRFEVRGPTGERACSMGPWRIEPIPDLFVRLRAGQKYRKSVDLTEYCAAEAFAKPGVYWVLPIYDPYLAERAPEPVFDRAVRGEPVPVRVRRGGG